MNIHTNSWHYRMVKMWCSFWRKEVPTNLCTYTKNLIISWLVIVFVLPCALFGVGLLPYTLLNGDVIEEWSATLPDPFSLLLFFSFFLGALVYFTLAVFLVAIFLWGMYVLCNIVTPIKANNSLFMNNIRAWKHKYCPTINFVRDEE